MIGELFESQLSAVEAGNRVSMTLGYIPGRVWKGNVDYVYPEVNPQTRTARVRMRFDNSDGTLRPGMFARLEIQGDRGKRQMLVPRESVIRTGNTDRVVVALEEGAFKSVNVTLGRVGDQYAEVLEGIMPGDTVVTSAQFLIDSESSKTSDFQRMSVPESDGMDPQMDHSGHNMDSAPKDPMTNHKEVDQQGMDHQDMNSGGMNHGGEGA